MSVKTIIQNHSKKIIGLALLTSFIVGQTVGASTTISDSIQSRGRITYDEDLDGTPEMKFDAQDLITTANGIDALNTDIALLSDSVSNLQDTTLAHKSNIIAGLNSNVYSKAPISNEATFEELIAYVNNIPAPTTATATYYNDGDNTGQGISNPADEIDINIEDTSHIDLGINESITLPSGYYPNGITISNNIANRSSTAFSALTEQGYPAGYYLPDQLSEIYNQGVLNGNVTVLSGVSYNLIHQHLDANNNIHASDSDYVLTAGGCYTKQGTYQSWEAVGSHVERHEVPKGYVYNGNGEQYWDGTMVTEYRSVTDYGYVTRTCYYQDCGHTYHEAVRSTTDYNSIAADEIIKSIDLIP